MRNCDADGTVSVEEGLGRDFVFSAEAQTGQSSFWYFNDSSQHDLLATCSQSESSCNSSSGWEQVPAVYNAYLNPPRSQIIVPDIVRGRFPDGVWTFRSGTSEASCTMDVIYPAKDADCVVTIDQIAGRVSGECHIPKIYSSLGRYSCTWMEQIDTHKASSIPGSETTFEKQNFSDIIAGITSQMTYFSANCSFNKSLPLNSQVLKYWVVISPGNISPPVGHRYVVAPVQASSTTTEATTMTTRLSPIPQTTSVRAQEMTSTSAGSDSESTSHHVPLTTGVSVDQTSRSNDEEDNGAKIALLQGIGIGAAAIVVIVIIITIVVILARRHRNSSGEKEMLRSSSVSGPYDLQDSAADQEIAEEDHHYSRINESSAPSYPPSTRVFTTAPETPYTDDNTLTNGNQHGRPQDDIRPPFRIREDSLEPISETNVYAEAEDRGNGIGARESLYLTALSSDRPAADSGAHVAQEKFFRGRISMDVPNRCSPSSDHAKVKGNAFSDLDLKERKEVQGNGGMANGAAAGRDGVINMAFQENTASEYMYMAVPTTGLSSPI